MKNRNFIKNSIALLLPISMGIGVLFGTQNKSTKETVAYSDSPLPTTIKLNDPDETTIRNYYSKLNSLSTDERKGNNLLKNLKPILSTNQNYYNYDTNDLIWNMYEITDRDWEKSPAVNIKNGSFNASTNTISNYVYQAGKTDESKNPYLHSYYMDYTQENVVKAWGNHNQNGTGINREHLWAKAEGFDGETGAKAGARGDPMHLVAANGYANNIHSNYFFGYVDTSKSFVDTKDRYSTVGHNLRGKSLTFPESTVEVFEPQDSDKGDIARAIFYMAARYNNIAGKTSSQEVFNSDNPNLLLTDDLSTWKSTGYTSSATNKGYMGLVSDLLEWNQIDPPDDYEIHRNNLLYTNFTNNRNPFIDFPQWADIIWGGKTGFASPSGDLLNGNTGEPRVTSISITSQPLKTTYIEGETFDPTGMVVTAFYSDGSSKVLSNSQYTLSINRELEFGDKFIAVTFERKTANVQITVEAKEKLKEITFDFENIDDFSSWSTAYSEHTIVSERGGQVYFSSANKPQSGLAIEGIPVSKSGQVIYTAPSGYKIKSFKLTCKQWDAKEKTISLLKSTDYGETFISTDVSSSNFILSSNFSSSDVNALKFDTSSNENQVGFISLYIEFFEEERIHPTQVLMSDSSLNLTVGSVVRLTATVLPEDSYNKEIVWSSTNTGVASVDQTGKVTFLSAGNSVIKATSVDGGIEGSCAITSYVPTLVSLELSGEFKTKFKQNDLFDSTGLIVTAIYSDGSESDVSNLCAFRGYDMSIASAQSVIVSYGGVTASYDITVASKQNHSTIYEKITSLNDIEEGKNYILGYETESVLKSMPNDFESGRLYKTSDLSISNEQITDSNFAFCISFENIKKDSGFSAVITNGAKYISENYETKIKTSNSKDDAFSFSIEKYDSETFKFIGPNGRVLMYSVSSAAMGLYASTNIGQENYKMLSIYKEVTSNNELFSFVDDPNNLRSGDRILMVGENENSFFTATTSESTGSFISAHEVSLINGAVSLDETSQVYEIFRVENKIAFYNPALEKYVSTISSGKNYLGYSSLCNDNCLFSINLIETTTQFEIQCDGEYSRNRLLFNYNSGTPRFSCYGQTSSNTANFYICKSSIQVEADDWAKDFITKTDECKFTSQVWNALKEDFLSLSDNAKKLIADSMYIDRDDTNMSWRQQAVARYDYIVGNPKYSVDAFITDREVLSSGYKTLPVFEVKNGTIIAIIAFAVTGLTVIGGYAFVKFKKEREING